MSPREGRAVARRPGTGAGAPECANDTLRAPRPRGAAFMSEPIRLARRVADHAKRAVSRYRVRESRGGFSLVEVTMFQPARPFVMRSSVAKTRATWKGS